MSAERPTHKSTTVPEKILDKSADEFVDLDPVQQEQTNNYFDNEIENDSEEEPLEELAQQARKRVCNSHDVYFKPLVFVEFFILHLLYFFILGPFIVILTPITGYFTLWNQGFVGLTPAFWLQLPQYILIVTLFIIYYTVPDVKIEFIEIFTLITAILIRCITISCKYSYSSEALLKIIKMKKLSPGDFAAELMASNWRVQNATALNEELHAGILRNDIESSLFFFEFIGKDKTHALIQKLKKENLEHLIHNTDIAPVPPEKEVKPSIAELEEDLQKKKKSAIAKSNWNKAIEKYVHNLGGTKDDKVTPNEKDDNTGTFSIDVNPALKIIRAQNQAKLHLNLENYGTQLQNFFKKKRLEKKKLYGYSLAFDILMKSRENRFSSFGIICLLVSLIKAFIPTFYRAYYGHEAFTSEPSLVILTIIINTYFFWANCFIMTISLADLQTKIFSIKQLAYLISPKKITSYRDKKYYPTLNIFDPITIKTWSNLRKLLLDFGLKFVQRNTLNISVVLIIYSFVLAFLVVQALDIVKTKSDPLILIIFAYETAVFFIIFLILLTGSAFINDQNRVHKSILKNNKTIISDFKRLSSLYIGDKAIKPDNFIYKQGVKILLADIKDKDKEKTVTKRADILADAIEDIIQELDFEAENNPIKVLGIPANYAIVKSLFALLASFGFAIFQVKSS